MRYPFGIKRIRLVLIRKGEYTLEATHDGTNQRKVLKWLRKNGKKVLERRLRCKIRNRSKDAVG